MSAASDTVVPRHTCPLCGHCFDHGTAVCGGCPLGGNCAAVCCPHCSYQFVAGSRILDMLGRWLRMLRRRWKIREEP